MDGNCRFRAEVAVLLDRIAEWTPDHLTKEGARAWTGHIEPSIERLRAALAGTDPAMPAVSGMDERTTLFGFKVVFDPAVPDGEIHMRRATGQMVGRIAGGEVVTRNPV